MKHLFLLAWLLVTTPTLAQSLPVSYDRAPYRNLGLSRSADGKQLFISLEYFPKGTLIPAIRMDVREMPPSEKVIQRTMITAYRDNRTFVQGKQLQHPGAYLEHYQVPMKKALPKGKAVYLVFYSDYFSKTSFFVADTIRTQEKFYDYSWAVR